MISAADNISDSSSLQLNEHQIVSNSGDYSISVKVNDSYDEISHTWTEDGHAVANANVSIFDSNNNLIFSGLTDKSGELSANVNNPGNYKVVFSYLTYKDTSYSVNIDHKGSCHINHIFIPDILLLMSYESHNEKMDILMNMSRRVAYISTYPNYEKEKEWLLEYAEYVHLDMYAETYSFTTDILKDTPANHNYKIAYTFGVTSESLIKTLGINFIGASSDNNTIDTLENTYIGSYFQAEDIEGNDEVLISNMRNYLDYIYYLLEPNKYSNPTLDPSRTPLITSTTGIYHPDYGYLTAAPSQSLINQWINHNLGYSGDGSLNWMVEDYTKWIENNLDPVTLINTFESWYNEKFGFNNAFVVIVSYTPDIDIVNALIRAYESEGRSAFNFYHKPTTPAMSSLLVKMQEGSKNGIVAVNSLYSWSLNYNNLNSTGAEEDLSKLDVVVLKAVNKISQESYESELGPQMEWTMQVTIPSFEGVYGAVVVSYLDENSNEHVIQGGVNKLVDLTLDWVNLKEKLNKDKKITIVLYDYPPGKGEIGASYLDVFQSTYDLLKQLSDEGYDIGMSKEDLPTLQEFTDLIVDAGNKGTWVPGLLNEYVEKHWDSLVEHGQLINISQYEEFLTSMNPTLQEKLIEKWGQGLGDIMVYKDQYIVIPGIFFGNVFITFQPSRGWEEQAVENYHDLELPPHQQYISFYKWLDNVLKTDAVINLGTHGTLEFLPGRSIGLQDTDWSFELCTTPTIYPYIVSNPGEGMVAKDRLASLIITHMTPAIVQSELYGNYTKLNEAISHYQNAIKVNSTDLAESYKEQIIKYAKGLNFDLQSKDQTFDQWVSELHNYLETMDDDLNALGLHSLGYVLAGNNLIEEIMTITASRTHIYNEIVEFIYGSSYKDMDYYEVLKKDAKYEIITKNAENWLKNYLSDLVYGNNSLDSLNTFYGIDKNSALYNSTFFALQVLLDIQNNNEWESLFSALNGSYVYAGLFADPSYSDSIPTGYNGYATDSTKMPSEAAYESAKKIVNQLLANYYELHGEWPELTALILWGTEILRTEGVGIAEFLYFLGCKPIWSATGAVTGFEIIPLKDLKVQLSNGSIIQRPRIDVYASIVTSNSAWISLMMNAVYAVNNLDESLDMNYLKKHYDKYQFLDRLFGLPGNILEGTGVSDLIPNTAKWEGTDVGSTLVDVYLDRVSYSWTVDEDGKISINKNKDNYKTLLSNTNLITQNIDSTWRFLDSDDYYDWFGGLYLASSKLGAKADTALVDIRNKNNMASRDLKTEIRLEVRTTVLNPKFIDVYTSSDANYLAYSKKVQNLFGTEVINNAATGESLLGDGIYNDLGNSMLEMSSKVNSVTSAAAMTSSMAWMLYASSQGYWKASSEMLDKLATTYMQIVVQYGVACCHHTCANIDFSMRLLKMSTAPSSLKKAYSDVLQAATLGQAVYDGSSDSQSSSDSQAQQITNGSSSQESSGVSNGQSSVGADASESTASNSQSSSSQSSPSDSSKGSSSSKAYEVSKTTSSMSQSTSSNMPVEFIIAVIVVLILFGFGFLRNRKNKDDF